MSSLPNVHDESNGFNVLPGYDEWEADHSHELTPQEEAEMEAQFRAGELPVLQPITLGVRQLNPEIWGNLG